MKESIISRIIRLIEERGMKDKEFCELVGISQSTFANWKTRGSTPKADLIPLIAKALNVTKSYILTGTEGPVESSELEGLNEIYLSLAREAQKNEIAPEDIKMAIKMIQEIRESESENKK